MYRPDHLPIHHVNNGQRPNLQRHHTARYYAHRVKESLTTRVSKFICTIFLFLFFIAGLITFIVWLSLRPHRPRFHIQEFSIPTLVQSSGPPESALVNYNLTIRNSNHKVTVHYSSIHAAVYYRDQLVGGVPLITEEFDQMSKTTKVLNSADLPPLTINTQRWAEMQRDIAAGSVPFRLEITSVIKLQIQHWWDSKTHKMHANCIVTLGSDASILPNLKNNKCRVYFT
ncbi:unnamed protein product [Amaranthus hypochondriacus]